MSNAGRIEMYLLGDELKNLINAGLKIFPVSYDFILANLNPNNYEYVKVTDTADHKREIYTWDEGWKLIGADDTSVSWLDIPDKPISYPPATHNHDELYSPLGHTHSDYALKTDLDNKANATDLDLKVDKVTGKGLSTNDFTNDDKTKLDSLSDTASVDYSTMQQSLNNHTGNATVHVTQTDKDNWNGKVSSSTFSGHTGNSTIHVTQTDKNNWNGKASNLTTNDLTLGGKFKISYNATTNSLDFVVI